MDIDLPVWQAAKAKGPAETKGRSAAEDAKNRVDVKKRIVNWDAHSERSQGTFYKFELSCAIDLESE